MRKGDKFTKEQLAKLNAAKKTTASMKKREVFPSTPICGFLERQIKNGRNVEQIEWATGINHRRITGILRSEYDNVSLSTIDHILTGLGYPEELHFLYPAEDEPATEAGSAYLEPDELRTAA